MDDPRFALDDKVPAMAMRAVWPTAVGLGLGLACADEAARPAILGDCNDPSCVDSRHLPAMIVKSELPAPSEGEAGAGGSGGVAQPVTTLQGDVRMIVEPDLGGAAPPNSPVEVRAMGADDTLVVGTPAADGSFRMDEVLSQERTWLAVGAFTDPPSEAFLDTYQTANSAAGLPVELAVMQRSVLEEIEQTSFAFSPRDLEPSRGHAIVQFVDALDLPVSGVSVTFPTASEADVAYDAGDLYSDALAETSARGTVVLLNMAAPPYPGGLTTVVATVASLPESEFRVQLRVSAGAVTLDTTVLELAP
jgi:hypothetical protein